ncbi:MAG TPA: hypothetical protein VMZ01_01275 [Aestuariivirga sp.]|nr:hypothetical protein [Aestuariivirga sp.]
MIRKFSLTICTALALACAAGTVYSANELLNRQGAASTLGSGATSTSTPIDAGSGLASGALRAPQAATPQASDALIEGLSGIKHGRDGHDTVIPVSSKLQMMLKARGSVNPPKPAKGGKLVQITNTLVSPYASMGMIMSGCSGALVMKRYVLTSAFCVFDLKAKKFYENLDFIPALNGDTAPVGTIAWKNVWIPKGFQEKGDLTYAFALIELDSDIGDQVGWFGFGPAQGTTGLKQLTLAGYPFADVPKNTLWEAKCSIDADEANAYFYRCPGQGSTVATMLGGPFFLKGAKEGDAGQLLGLHTGPQDEKQNSWWAMKLNDTHTQTLISWANGGEVPPEPEVTDETDEVADDTPACTCDQGAGSTDGEEE